jgi:N utilization substance protein B
MRRLARELAIQSLFQMEFAPQVRLEELAATAEIGLDKENLKYARELLSGLIQKKSEVDAKIQNVAQHWKMDRMASVDRNILRLAVFEMNFFDQKVEPAIVINEAIEIAKKYGTSDSASFINGILDQVRKGL